MHAKIYGNSTNMHVLFSVVYLSTLLRLSHITNRHVITLYVQSFKTLASPNTALCGVCYYKSSTAICDA